MPADVDSRPPPPTTAHSGGPRGVDDMGSIGWRSQRRRADAFEALFRREFLPIVRALTLVADDVDVATRAVHEAFAEAHHRLDHVLALEDPGAWLRGVALQRLRVHRRRDDAVVALYYLFDQPTPAIAQRLGLREATVRSDLRRSRDRLMAEVP